MSDQERLTARVNEIAALDAAGVTAELRANGNPFWDEALPIDILSLKALERFVSELLSVGVELPELSITHEGETEAFFDLPDFTYRVLFFSGGDRISGLCFSIAEDDYIWESQDEELIRRSIDRKHFWDELTLHGEQFA